MMPLGADFECIAQKPILCLEDHLQAFNLINTWQDINLANQAES
jgi:hypothetical protein